MSSAPSHRMYFFKQEMATQHANAKPYCGCFSGRQWALGNDTELGCSAVCLTACSTERRMFRVGCGRSCPRAWRWCTTSYPSAWCFSVQNTVKADARTIWRCHNAAQRREWISGRLRLETGGYLQLDNGHRQFASLWWTLPQTSGTAFHSPGGTANIFSGSSTL